jgi:hypothetical protein
MWCDGNPSAAHSSSELSWVSTVSQFSRTVPNESSPSNFIESFSNKLLLDSFLFSDRFDEDNSFSNQRLSSVERYGSFLVPIDQSRHFRHLIKCRIHFCNSSLKTQPNKSK